MASAKSALPAAISSSLVGNALGFLDLSMNSRISASNWTGSWRLPLFDLFAQNPRRERRSFLAGKYKRGGGEREARLEEREGKGKEEEEAEMAEGVDAASHVIIPHRSRDSRRRRRRDEEWMNVERIGGDENRGGGRVREGMGLRVRRVRLPGAVWGLENRFLGAKGAEWVGDRGSEVAR